MRIDKICERLAFTFVSEEEANLFLAKQPEEFRDMYHAVPAKN